MHTTKVGIAVMLAFADNNQAKNFNILWQLPACFIQLCGKDLAPMIHDCCER